MSTYLLFNLQPENVVISLKDKSGGVVVFLQTLTLSVIADTYTIPNSAIGAEKSAKIILTPPVAAESQADTSKFLYDEKHIPELTFSAPEHWNVAVNKTTGVITITLSSDSVFQSATITINNFYTTTEAGTAKIAVTYKDVDLFLPNFDEDKSQKEIDVIKYYAVHIDSFTADKTFAAPDEAITLSWEVTSGASASIKLSRDGKLLTPVQSWSSQYVDDDPKRIAKDHTYTLTVPDGKGGELSASALISLTYWKEQNVPQGFTPDFTYPGQLCAIENTVYAYCKKLYFTSDFEGGKWSSVALPSPPKGVKFADNAPIAVYGGNVWIFCGYDGKYDGNDELWCAVYNPTTKTWSVVDSNQYTTYKDGVACAVDKWFLLAKKRADTVTISQQDGNGEFWDVYNYDMVDKSTIDLFDMCILQRTAYIAMCCGKAVTITSVDSGGKWGIDSNITLRQKPSWLRLLATKNCVYLVAPGVIYSKANYDKSFEQFMPALDSDTVPWLGTRYETDGGNAGNVILQLNSAKGAAGAWINSLG